MEDKRFNHKKLDKLNNPKRYQALPPELMIEKVGNENPKVIIDLGAGTGFYAIPWAQKYKDSKIYACDISEHMIAWMQANITSEYEQIIPLQMKDNSIPLEDNIADVLFMVNLHHELNHHEKMLTECHRLLKSKGKIAISDWKKEETEQGPPLAIRFSAQEIKEQLLATGFTSINIDTSLRYNYLIVAEKA